MSGARRFRAYRLGRMRYGPCHALQQRLGAARTSGEVGDTVLFVEHDPVVTLGRRAKPEHLLRSPEALAAQGVEVHDVGRGGDVTYHGPGQLVMYPIIDLKPDRRDVRRYVWSLEETMIRTCADYGVTAERVAGYNGAWVGDDKIGAVGVRISRWVTMHGIGFNVSTRLEDFSVIVPCGIATGGVTSLERELGRAVPMAEVVERSATHLSALYEASLEWSDPAALRTLAEAAPAPDAPPATH